MTIVATGGVPMVTASSWLEYKVKDRSGGIVGEGVEFSGRLRSPSGVRPAYLNVECTGDGMVVRIEVRNFDFGVWPVALRWRTDEGAERTDTWLACDNGACIGAWNGQGVAFLQSLLAVKELELTLEQRYEKTMRATFPVGNAGDAMQIVSRRCRWQHS